MESLRNRNDFFVFEPGKTLTGVGKGVLLAREKHKGISSLLRIVTKSASHRPLSYQRQKLLQTSESNGKSTGESGKSPYKSV
jgi:hypothetical protein